MDLPLLFVWDVRSESGPPEEREGEGRQKFKWSWQAPTIQATQLW